MLVGMMVGVKAEQKVAYSVDARVGWWVWLKGESKAASTVASTVAWLAEKMAPRKGDL